MFFKKRKNKETLIREINEIGPWHMAISLNNEVNTGMAETKDSGRFLSPSLSLNREKTFKKMVNNIYPNGLGGKTFLDHACNSGGLCFWAKDLGAKYCYGYDVREHWIRQAKYVLKHREMDSSNIKFKVMDLYDLPKNLPKKKQFDISWFSGIFYHLPDPVRGLKIAADKTKELLVVSTATKNDLDPEPEEGVLFRSWEGKDYLMTGVYNLNWFPSGPNCLKGILKWLGFPHARIIKWKKQVINKRRPDDKSHRIGRLLIVASRNYKTLRNIKDAVPIESVEANWHNSL
ncbi:class I SAM-dependent methyltransferase [Candidatus Uabimicrobium sp. HlEnr_7]|uniref:class I SAM-dependent methyltransferase n=1 Tax=Candidatus Uabimicrobium helgolandensis TaxID=3095367 RepID=UPI0035587D4A